MTSFPELRRKQRKSLFFSIPRGAHISYPGIVTFFSVEMTLTIPTPTPSLLINANLTHAVTSCLGLEELMNSLLFKPAVI